MFVTQVMILKSKGRRGGRFLQGHCGQVSGAAATQGFQRLREGRLSCSPFPEEGLKEKKKKRKYEMNTSLKYL